jgi:hypothetical protein
LKGKEGMSEQTENGYHDIIGMNDKSDTKSDHPSKISSFFAFSEKLSSSEYLRLFIIVLLPVLILLKYPVDRVDYDLWWHMALGKYYITHHTLTIDHSIFSWTPIDPTWIYNTCLGSIAIYLFYNFMGGFGLWLFQSLVFLGVFFSFYLFLRVVHQRLDLNSVTIIAAIGIACSMSCRYYKPELFSVLLFCWTVFIFFYVKIIRNKFIFYLYPLMFAFWVNLHGAFVVGLVFLGMALTGEILNRIFFSGESFTTGELVHFGIACVLSLLATLLNPYGVYYLLSTYSGITSEINTAMNKYVLAYVSLWSFLKVKGLSSFTVGLIAWIMTTMMFSIFVLSVYEIIKKKSFDFAVLIISIALYWKGMETSRTSYFFPIVFFFVFFYLLIHRLKINNFSGRATIFSLPIFVFFFTIIIFFNIRYGTDNTWFGQGLDNFVPVKEVAFLKKYKLDGLIFNDYVIGGYLMWDLYPDYKVFIDPRCSPYIKQVFPDYMELTSKHVNREDIRRFREKYPFKIAILHYRQMALIFDLLKAEGDEWRLLYFEKNAAILIHKSLLSIIKSEAGNVNLNPIRFNQVSNPDILINVFNFYVRLNPKAGRSIYNIFEKNVSDYYKLKPDILRVMDMDIKLKEKDIENKAYWMSP